MERGRMSLLTSRTTLALDKPYICGYIPDKSLNALQLEEMYSPMQRTTWLKIVDSRYLCRQTNGPPKEHKSCKPIFERKKDILNVLFFSM